MALQEHVRQSYVPLGNGKQGEGLEVKEGASGWDAREGLSVEVTSEQIPE